MARAPDSKSGRWWFESTGRCSAHDHSSPCSSVVSPIASAGHWRAPEVVVLSPLRLWRFNSVPTHFRLGINRYRPPARVVFDSRIFDACSVTTGSTGFGWFTPVAQIGKSNRLTTCKLPVQVRSGHQWIGAQAPGLESPRSSRLVSTRIPIWKCNGLGRRSVVSPVALFVNLHQLA